MGLATRDTLPALCSPSLTSQATFGISLLSELQVLCLKKWGENAESQKAEGEMRTTVVSIMNMHFPQ